MTLSVATIQDVAPPAPVKSPSGACEFARLLGTAPTGRAASGAGQRASASPLSVATSWADAGPAAPADDFGTPGSDPDTAPRLPAEAPRPAAQAPVRRPSGKAAEEGRPEKPAAVSDGSTCAPIPVVPDATRLVASAFEMVSAHRTTPATGAGPGQAAACKPGEAPVSDDRPAKGSAGPSLPPPAERIGPSGPLGPPDYVAEDDPGAVARSDDTIGLAGPIEAPRGAASPSRLASRLAAVAAPSAQDPPASSAAGPAGAPPGQSAGFTVPSPDGSAPWSTATPVGPAPGSAATPDGPAPGSTATPAGPVPPPDSFGGLAPPTAQLGHALARLHTAPDGGSRLTVQLDPAELGQVRIHITRGQDGSASVSVGVERPETLRGLQADLPHLHLVLDRAGLPEHRSVSFHLAAPDTPSSAASQGGLSGEGAGQQSSGGAGQGRGPPASPLRHGAASSSAHDTGASPAAPATSRRWVRAGVDINA